MEGLLLRGKESYLKGGWYWKKKWAQLENDIFYHGSGEVKSSLSSLNNTPAKYIFDVKRCEISVVESKQYCFKILDRKDGRTMVFAADNLENYNKWVDAFSTSASVNREFQKIDDSYQAKSSFVMKVDNASSLSDIFDYFMRFNSTMVIIYNLHSFYK